MGSTSFVVMLFVMAFACFGISISESAWGWSLGGVVFLFVGVMALRQHKEESEAEEPETASSKFILFAFLALFVGFAMIIALSKA